MELIIMLLARFPIGYLIRNRMAICLAYVALHSFVFTFQSTTMPKERTGGDYSAFVQNPATADWSLRPRQPRHPRRRLGLVAVGAWPMAKRRRAAQPAIDLVLLG